MTRIFLTGAAGLVALLAACASQQSVATGPDADLKQIAHAIAAACPAGTPGPKGRDACADGLARLGLLETAVTPGQGIRWGGTGMPGDYEPEHNKLTTLDSLVWRKLYLSLYSFTGQYTIEPQANGDRVLLLDAALRELPPEDFPYPFWHSAAKWQAYHQARQIALVFRKDRLIAGYRAKLDTTIPVVDTKWDGKWQWEENGVTVPRVSLYEYTLSKANPERAALDAAYRDFEAAARPYNCNGCHNPANPRGMNPLIFFTHPAQALAGRHEMVDAIAAGKMPPPDGIKDPAERQKLADLAKRFAEEGDRALAFEQRQASK